MSMSVVFRSEKMHKETRVFLFELWSSFLEARGLQLHHAKGFALFPIDPVILSWY